jgi:hypothetical protein
LLHAGLPVVVGRDEAGDGVLDLMEVLFEDGERAFEAFANGFDTALPEAVGLGGAVLDELPSSGDEFVEFVLAGMGLEERAGLDGQGESGEDGGVESVGLGQDAEGFGEVADLSGVDDGDGVSGGDEFGDEGEVVGSGGFEDDETGLRCGELVLELVASFGVGGDAERGLGGKEMDIEVVFGDIDADEG